MLIFCEFNFFFFLSVKHYTKTHLDTVSSAPARTIWTDHSSGCVSACLDEGDVVLPALLPSVPGVDSSRTNDRIIK